MNTTELTGIITRGLVRNGVARVTAEAIALRTMSDQPEEWNRIIGRSSASVLPHVYVFVTKFGEHRFTTFVYAPGGVDNSAVIRELLGTDTGAGCLVNESRPTQDQESEAKPGAFPVDVYDVAEELNRAVRAVSR